MPKGSRRTTRSATSSFRETAVDRRIANNRHTHQITQKAMQTMKNIVDRLRLILQLISLGENELIGMQA